MKKVKSAFLFVFLFVFLTYKIFIPDFFDPYFYDICSLSYIDAKIEKRLSRSENGSKKSKETLRNINEKMASLGLSPEDTDKFKKLNFRLAILKQNQCPIPEDVERDFYILSGMEEGAGNKECSADMFLEESKKRVNEMSKYPDVYKYAEYKIHDLISKSSGNSRFSKAFEEKWNDPDIRKTFMVSQLQMTARQDNGCKDISIPIRPFLNEFLYK